MLDRFAGVATSSPALLQPRRCDEYVPTNSATTDAT
jgi:hypothetical protein